MPERKYTLTIDTDEAIRTSLKKLQQWIASGINGQRSFLSDFYSLLNNIYDLLGASYGNSHDGMMAWLEAEHPEVGDVLTRISNDFAELEQIPSLDTRFEAFRREYHMSLIANEYAGWVPLKDLREGALFKTRGGTYAVKSEYRYENGVCQCILLESGEYAHFKDGNETLVREVKLGNGEPVENQEQVL